MMNLLSNKTFVILKVLIIALTFVITITSGEEFSIASSPFCSKCTCNDTDKTVLCKDALEKNINSTEFWIRKEGNESTSYPFFKVSVKSSFARLSPFPESPVKILDLSNNRIEVIDKACFNGLQNMSELDLSYNDLTSELFTPNIFEGHYKDDDYKPLRSLRILRVAGNGLHTLHQDIFQHIEKLEILDLKGNPLRIIDMHTTMAISGLIYLKRLDISYTFITKLPDHIFHAPKNLKELDLSGNFFEKVPTLQLADAHNLEFLSLNENPIGNLTKENGFPQLKKLKILHLCYMGKLERIENESMSGLWQVKELHITNNDKLRFIAPNTFKRLEEDDESPSWPLVNKLYLNKNKLSHLSHELLSRWDQLDEIDITDNAWSCDCTNQWLLETLVRFAVEKNVTHQSGLFCASPVEMEKISMTKAYEEKETFRCLDLYDARPERDAGILIGVLIGLLTGIPLVLGVMYCYKRKFFGYLSAGPAGFSRKFYNAAANEEEIY